MQKLHLQLPYKFAIVKQLKFFKLRKIGTKALLVNIEKRIRKVKGDFRQKPVETGIKVVATCDNCGRKTMLNFEPDLNKPIYCKDCLKKKYPKPSRQPIGLAEEATRQKPVSLKEAMDSQVQDFRRGRKEE